MHRKKSLVSLLLITCLALTFLPHIPKAHAETFSEWPYTKLLTFSDGSEGLQVNFNVTYGGLSGCEFNCQSDFEDLRFVDAYNGELLSAWNESTVDSDYCEVWLKLGSTLEVVMHYGNPEAESVWDKDAVFVDVIGGVVLGLPMNEATAEENCVDYSGNGNDGVPTGTTVVDGKFAGTKARQFDGENDNVVVANDEAITGFSKLTFLFWVNTTIVPETTKYILDFGYWTAPNFGLLVRQLENGNFDFFMKNTDGDVIAWGNSLVGEGWVQMALVWDGVNAILYKNNVSLGSQALDAQINPSTDFYIGGNGAACFIGSQCQYIIFNTNISTEERTNIYSNYGDVTLEEGSCLVRKWVDPMPTVTFGTQETAVLNSDDLVGLIVVFFAIGIAVSLTLVVGVRRK